MLAGPASSTHPTPYCEPPHLWDSQVLPGTRRQPRDLPLTAGWSPCASNGPGPGKVLGTQGERTRQTPSLPPPGPPSSRSGPFPRPRPHSCGSVLCGGPEGKGPSVHAPGQGERLAQPPKEQPGWEPRGTRRSWLGPGSEGRTFRAEGPSWAVPEVVGNLLRAWKRAGVAGGAENEEEKGAVQGAPFCSGSGATGKRRGPVTGGASLGPPQP